MEIQSRTTERTALRSTPDGKRIRFISSLTSGVVLHNPLQVGAFWWVRVDFGVWGSGWVAADWLEVIKEAEVPVTPTTNPTTPTTNPTSPSTRSGTLAVTDAVINPESSVFSLNESESHVYTILGF